MSRITTLTDFILYSKVCLRDCYFKPHKMENCREFKLLVGEGWEEKVELLLLMRIAR